MKLVSIVIVDNDKIFKSHYITDDIPFWSRSNVIEITNETVLKISQERKDIIVNISDYKCHLCINDLISVAVITDAEYPTKVAIDLCRLVNKSSDLKKLCIEYQDPATVDKILKIQKEIDDIKDIMHVNIEKIIQRGDSIQDLLIKSENLSFSSKAFLKGTKDLNSCCVLI